MHKNRFRILCYGDSNTYGYDPRDGDRYDAERRWTDLLADDEYEVVNEGQNGREIPTSKPEYGYLNSILKRHGNIDMLVLALGVNDAYNMRTPDAAAIADRWRKVFKNVPALSELKDKSIPIILVSPPVGPTDTWGNDKAEEVLDALEGLSTEYKKLADEESLIFADADTFGVELAYDGVHFTEDGSRAFYKKIKEIIFKYKAQ